MRRVPGMLAALALTASACGSNERAAGLEREIAALRAERMDRAAVEKARAGLAEIEGRLDAASGLVRSAAEILPALESRVADVRRTAEAERERSRSLSAEVTQQAERTALERKAAEALRNQIERVQARAAVARDQVKRIARELRPGDPDWATERRRAVFGELLDRLAREWEGDAGLAAASQELARSSGAEEARALALRLASRFESVYELPGSADEPPRRATGGG